MTADRVLSVHSDIATLPHIKTVAKVVSAIVNKTTRVVLRCGFHERPVTPEDEVLVPGHLPYAQQPHQNFDHPYLRSVLAFLKGLGQIEKGEENFVERSRGDKEIYLENAIGAFVGSELSRVVTMWRWVDCNQVMGRIIELSPMLLLSLGYFLRDEALRPDDIPTYRLSTRQEVIYARFALRGRRARLDLPLATEMSENPSSRKIGSDGIKPPPKMRITGICVAEDSRMLKFGVFDRATRFRLSPSRGVSFFASDGNGVPKKYEFTSSDVMYIEATCLPPPKIVA